MILDIAAINGLFLIYDWLRLGAFFLVPFVKLLLSSISFVFLGRFIGVYDSLTRFFNFHELKKYALLLLVFSFILTFLTASGSFEQWFVIFFTVVSATIPYRFLVKQLNSTSTNSLSKLALLYGAGDQGVYLKRSFFNSPHFKIVGFIDDNTSLHGRKIDGVYVYGLGDELDQFINKNKVAHVIFSTNKITAIRKLYLLDYFRSNQIQTYNLPSTDTWVNRKPSAAQLRKIRIEDILARPEINIDFELNRKYYEGKRVLITGGAGSIGSELVRQLLSYDPQKVIVVDINETALFYLKSELQHNKNLELLLQNVLDGQKIQRLFEEQKIDYVFHAAAYKHVSVVEENPIQSLRNNIVGTYNVVQSAKKFGVKKFVLVSTDKAVNPTNLMGASKRYCELLVNALSMNVDEKTEFITTRFGNVLGSNGSVIPIFRDQIEKGGPITLTHPDITRYFMTIPEASKLVIESGRIGQNNQVYVFDMGKPLKILDMAKNMISLSGYRPYEDIDIEIVGLRPGEKLYEQLLLDTETMIPSSNKYLFTAKRELISSDTYTMINEFCEKLIHIEHLDGFELVKKLKLIIPEYKSNNSPYEVLDHD
jgi:FlaA1/EpsC-like NDP-sugar epimerase